MVTVLGCALALSVPIFPNAAFAASASDKSGVSVHHGAKATPAKLHAGTKGVATRTAFGGPARQFATGGRTSQAFDTGFAYRAGKGRQAGLAFPGKSSVRHGRNARFAKSYAYRGPTLQCVAYARSASSISLSGNAADWWDNAAGLYARGHRPQPGSVLAFTANGRMRLGHVAVVSQVVNGREILINHANWAGPGAYRGSVARGVAVVDVSAANDWTAVRVGLGSSGDFGSVYPTYGFIYDRPDDGVRVASVRTPVPALELNPAPRDLRPAYAHAPLSGNWAANSYAGQSFSYDEVAEAPTRPRHGAR